MRAVPQQQLVTFQPGAVSDRRKAAGLTQATLAELANVSEAFISHIETGRRQPGYANALAIARALGVDLTTIADVRLDGDAA